MQIFAVQYRYTDDSAGRDAHRAEHRAYLDGRPEMLLAGPFSDDPAGGLLLVDVADEAAARAVTEGDPFVQQGLVAEVTVRPYNAVLGRLAPTLEG